MNTVTIYDKELVPVNKQARIMTSPTNDMNIYSPNLPSGSVTDAPPLAKSTRPRNIENLIGTKSGKITIYSYYYWNENATSKSKDKHPPHLWVGRCVCGRYEIRSGYKWRRKLRQSKEDKGCVYCRREDQLFIK